MVAKKRWFERKDERKYWAYKSAQVKNMFQCSASNEFNIQITHDPWSGLILEIKGMRAV